MEKLLKRELTNGCDNSDGEIKRAGKLPLPPGAVRLPLERHPLHVSVVVLGEAVLLLQLAKLLLQHTFPGTLAVRLQRVEDGGSQEQVAEDGEDEREGPDVPRLHPRLRGVRGAEGAREGWGRVLPLRGGAAAAHDKTRRPGDEGASSGTSRRLQRCARAPFWPVGITAHAQKSLFHQRAQ